MLIDRDPNLRVVLLGLPADIAESLGHIVSRWGAVLYIPPLFPLHRSLGLIREARPHLVFVSTDESHGTSLAEALRKAEPQLQIVAVNSYAKNRQSPEALDSGVTDYCTPPFDSTRIQNLLHATSHATCC